jgi:hypothetical protein
MGNGDTTVSRRHWADVPRYDAVDEHPLRDRLEGPARALAAVLIAAAVPVVRIGVVLGWWRAIAVGAITLIGLALHASLGDRWLARGAVAAAAGAAVIPPGGIQTALWVSGGIVLAGWVTDRRPPLPFLPRASDEAMLPVLVITAVTVWRQRTTWTWDVLYLHAALTFVAILVTSRFDRLPQRFGRAVGQTISRVLFTVIAVPTVVLPWVVFRLLRIDPLASGGDRGTSWQRLGHRDVQPDRPWIAMSRARTPMRQRPWQQLAAAGAAAVLLIGGIWAVAFRDDPGTRVAYNLSSPEGTPTADTIPAAFRDAEWYPKYKEDIEYAYTWTDGFPPVDGMGLTDFLSEHINTEGGVRRSWSAPACECRRVTVWIYGASTVFGLGQRDEYTIPSHLAKAAWEDGLAVDVVNRGVPAEQHWQEANRLRWDLSRAEEPPDVVVFYDGASDTVGASWLNEQRLGDVDTAVQPLTEGFLEDPAIRDVIDEALRGGGTAPTPAPGGVREVPRPTVPEMTPEEVGELAARRYERSLRMSRDLTEANRLTTFWFWQPTRLSRPHVPGEPTTDLDDSTRATVERAAQLVPDGVVNLSDVLDDDRRPMFSDDVHHNEEAAEVIGRSIYGHLESTLRRLSSG